jgi:hypothetical protein
VTIWLWQAGASSGTAASRELAQERAGACLVPGAEALVEEAEPVLRAVARGGRIPEHRRTGKAWRGILLGGVPFWEPARADAP